ncbi:MAG: polymer-forming cytoskeletal protein [Gemmatimonadota bacterium]
MSREVGPDVSVITKDMRVAGDIETTGAIRIEGTVSGSVRAASLELTATGAVNGDLIAAEGDSVGGAFVVAGSVQGAVRAHQVEVCQGGTVLSGVVAETATVRGRILGGILARGRLALTATAVVEGDVHARRLALEEGGQVNGNIRIGDQAAVERRAATPQAPDARPQEPGLVAVGAERESARAQRAG